MRQGDLTSRLTCDGNINDDFDRNLIQNFKGGEKTLKIYQHFRPFLRDYCLKTYIRSNVRFVQLHFVSQFSHIKVMVIMSIIKVKGKKVMSSF